MVKRFDLTRKTRHCSVRHVRPPVEANHAIGKGNSVPGDSTEGRDRSGFHVYCGAAGAWHRIAGYADDGRQSAIAEAQRLNEYSDDEFEGDANSKGRGSIILTIGSGREPIPNQSSAYRRNSIEALARSLGKGRRDRRRACSPLRRAPRSPRSEDRASRSTRPRLRWGTTQGLLSRLGALQRSGAPGDSGI